MLLRNVCGGHRILRSLRCAINLPHEETMLFNRDVQLDLFTDRKSLFEIRSKGSHTPESSLMLEAAAARKGFELREISNIGIFRIKCNIADGLTEAMKQASLR